MTNVFFDSDALRTGEGITVALGKGTVPFSSDENRDSPPLIDSPILKRFRRLTLAARRRSGLAAGLEEFGLRDYAPGDDYRRIDWKLCSRRDELLTKVYPPYKDQHTYVLLDCSPSMSLGSPSKFHLACQIAGLLGYAALEHLDCLHVTGFADGSLRGCENMGTGTSPDTDLAGIAHVGSEPVPIFSQPLSETGPLRGGARVGRLMRFLHDVAMQGSQTDLTRTAAAFASRCQPHGTVAVISDLYDRRGFREAFDILLHRGYQPRLFHIYAPCEAAPGLLGDVELEDVEAGTVQEATITEWAAERYRQRFAEFCQSVRDYCRRRVIPLVQVASNVPEDEVLMKLFA